MWKQDFAPVHESITSVHKFSFTFILLLAFRESQSDTCVFQTVGFFFQTNYPAFLYDFYLSKVKTSLNLSSRHTCVLRNVSVLLLAEILPSLLTFSEVRPAFLCMTS